jgi:hypothetical protein
MPEPANRYSLWTIPREAWSNRRDLDAVTVTPETVERLKRSPRDQALEERIRAFQTPLTPDTLRRPVE